MAIMKFSTSHLKNLFSEGAKYDWEGTRNLMFDLANGRKVYDKDGQEVTKEDANRKMREVIFSILELDPNGKNTKRDCKRAMRRHGAELFEVIEELVDLKIVEGFRQNDFFNDFVEYRNIALGDSLEFYTEDRTILAVSRVAGSHHDFSLQRLGEGESFTLSVDRYGAAVGADIDRYLAGQEDWAKMISKLGEAFTSKILNAVYTAVIGAYTQIPVSESSYFVGNGALVKATFDNIIENVAGLNESDVYIMGTKTALRQLNNLTTIDWRTESQKEDVARTGRLGYYEGTDLIELPQRFENGDVTKRLVDDEILLIMPKTSDNKFVWMVDQGETLIDEITERGEEHGRIDDVMKYEMQRAFGVTVKIGRHFGAWILGD